LATGTYTLGDIGGTTLMIEPNLGYSTAQSILIVYNISNYQTSTVVSYDKNTGTLIFTGATAVVGSGLYGNWTVNLAGAAGGNGSSGSAGSSGTSGAKGTSGSSGATGSSGASGSSGTSGSSGSSGTSGSSGSSGTSASSGSSGSSGTSASSGSSGTSGSSASSGTSGTAGTAGSSGSSASSGSSGTSGSSATSGTAGTAGTGFTTVTNPGTNRMLIANGTSGNSAIAVSGVTYDGSTLNVVGGITSTGAGSFSAVTVNGQPTTYGNVNGSYLFASNNADQSNVGNGTAVIFQSSNASNGSLIIKGSNTQVTLTAGNTYKMEAIIRRFQSSNTWGTFKWYDVTNSTYVGVEAFGETVTSPTSVASTGIATYYVTPSVNTTYELRQTTVNTITVSSGYASYEITQVNPTVAIQATATGTLNTDYLQVGRITSNQSVSNAATPQDIVFNNTVVTNSGIPYSTSTGIFTLTAGKTYELEAQVTYITMAANTNYILFTWVDATANTSLDSSGASVGTVIPTTWGGQVGTPNANYGGLSKLIYTPSTNQTVKLRIISGLGSGSIMASQGTYAKITQVANQFALTSISGLTTTGDVNVGGNLTVTGNTIVNGGAKGPTPSWSLSDSASATYFLLGTWNTAQIGNSLYMRLIGHVGYNANSYENQVTELMFATSNASSYITGSSGNFYANGLASVNSRLGTGGTSPSYKAPNSFRIIQVSQTQYQIYAYFSAAYMRNSNYSIQIPAGDTWVDGGGSPVSAPSGNYITITPTAF
jgi:hypothetical protein